MARDETRIWAHKLTLAKVIFLAARIVAVNKAQVFYDRRNASEAALWALRLIGFGVTRFFKEMDLGFGKKNEHGETLKYELKEITRNCTNLFLKSNGCEKDKENIKKALLQAYFSDKTDEILRQWVMVAAVIRRLGHTGKKDVIQLEGSIYAKTIKEFFNRRGEKYGIEFGCPLKDMLAEVAAFAYALGMVFLSLWRRDGFDGNTDTRKNSVWFEYYDGCLEMKKTRSLFFWGDHYDRKNGDVVFYIDRGDTPTAGHSRRIEEAGEKWVDARGLWKGARLGLSDVLEVCGRFFRAGGGGFWARLFETRAFAFQKLFESVYRKCNVKILIQHQEAGWKAVTQYAGLKAAGGISIGTPWSNYPYYNEPQFTMPHDVMFVWGKAFFELASKMEWRICDKFLPCGLWIREEKSQNPRELLCRKTKFFLGVFDSSYHWRHHPTPEMMSEFYGMILGALEENLSWGALVKGKSESGGGHLRGLPDGERLARMAEKLEKEGRLVFLPKTMSPATVALKADLSVSFGINTACVVGGALGGRVLMWDGPGFKRNFFYKSEGQRVVFENLGELKKTIKAVADGDKEAGDFRRWAKLFDHFSDGRAAERVGKFINSYMLRTNKGESADDALEECVAEYLRENGIGEDFRRLENIFENEGQQHGEPG